MSVVAQLIAELGTACAGLTDQRKGPRHDGDYTMADIGLSAFSLFFMGSPSFLAHQRTLERGQGRSNCQTLFGVSAIPSDNYIRLMLDGASPAAFDGLFMRAIEAVGPLTRFQRPGSHQQDPPTDALADAPAGCGCVADSFDPVHLGKPGIIARRCSFALHAADQTLTAKTGWMPDISAVLLLPRKPERMADLMMA